MYGRALSSKVFARLASRTRLRPPYRWASTSPGDVIDGALNQLSASESCEPFLNVNTLELETDWSGVERLAAIGLPSAQKFDLLMDN